MTDVASVQEVKCALCGQGSHRLDWKGKTEVFCDTHTATEIKAYRASKTPTPTPVAKVSTPTPPAAPQTSAPVPTPVAETA